MANENLTVEEMATEMDATETDATGVRTTRTATDGATSSIGNLDENVAGALAYLFGFITGIVFLVMEKESAYVRFQAAQSLVVFGGIVTMSILLTFVSIAVGLLFGDFLGFLVGSLVTLGSLGLSLVGMVLWVFLMYRAYSGTTFRVPIAAGIADGLVK